MSRSHLLLSCCAIASLLFAPTSSAQAPDPQSSLVELLELDRRLQAREASLAKARGAQREKEETLVHTSRAELFRELDRLIEEKRAEAQTIERVGEIVAREDVYLRKRASESARALRAFNAEAVPEDDKEAAEHAQEGRARAEEVDQTLAELLNNATRAEKLGQDAAPSYAVLDPLVQQRAESILATLETAHKTLKASLSNKGDKTDELKAEQAALREKTEFSSASLKRIIGIMDGRGIDAVVYKRRLVELSGEITSDVLDDGVASGIVASWWRDTKKDILKAAPAVAFKAVMVLAILLGAWLLAMLARFVTRIALSVRSRNRSKLLVEFLISLSGKAVWFGAFLAILSQFGIEPTSMLAGLGVVGIVIGFALQGTLSNFASGLMILVYLPYDEGDLVEVAGVEGRVVDMTLVSTTVRTVDNQRLIIPNNKVWGEVIRNVEGETARRVDLVFGVSYSDDVEKVKGILTEILESHPMVLKTHESVVRVHTLNNSSVDFVVRPWVRPADYWPVYWDVTEAVKRRFDGEGISIPFPQHDVHLIDQASA